MGGDAFDRIEQAIRTQGAAAGLDLLANELKAERNYPLLFEARLLRSRHDLGLPPLLTTPIRELPDEQRRAYEQSFQEAAREAGSLYLEDGDIVRAWPYFRAIGETESLAGAIDKADPQRDDLEGILHVALEERVNPRKGFALLLARYGVCRAITLFEQYPDSASREECLGLLVRTLHDELTANLRRAVETREGPQGTASGLAELMAGRDWLFGDLDSYVDTSHVISVIRFALDSRDPETLRLALELCDYGSRLSPKFHYRADPPFDDVYRDHAVYLRALVGEDVEGAIAHFRAKIAAAGPEAGSAPAQVLVAFLARLERYRDAIQVSIEHLSALRPDQLACMPVQELCQLAGDYGLMRSIARDRGDFLCFTAAVLGEVASGARASQILLPGALHPGPSY